MNPVGIIPYGANTRPTKELSDGAVLLATLANSRGLQLVLGPCYAPVRARAISLIPRCGRGRLGEPKPAGGRRISSGRGRDSTGAPGWPAVALYGRPAVQARRGGEEGRARGPRANQDAPKVRGANSQHEWARCVEYSSTYSRSP